MLKTAAEDPRYLEHKLVRRYSGEIALMSASAAAGHNLGWESPEHRINVKAGALVNSGILAEMVLGHLPGPILHLTPTMEGDWVGLDNYRRLLASGEFRRSLPNNLTWTAGTLSLQLIFGIFTDSAVYI